MKCDLLLDPFASLRDDEGRLSKLDSPSASGFQYCWIGDGDCASYLQLGVASSESLAELPLNRPQTMQP